MKKRKTFLTVALLAGILALGIGYAAITGGLLEITGTAKAVGNDENFKVGFNTTFEPAFTGSTSGCEPSVVYKEGDGFDVKIGDATVGTNSVTLTADQFTKKDDTAVVTLQVKNFSEELKAQLGDFRITTTDTEDAKGKYVGSTGYFDVTAVYKDAPADGNIVLGPNDVKEITVTIKLKKSSL